MPIHAVTESSSARSRSSSLRSSAARASGKITRKITDYCSSLIKAFNVIEKCAPAYNMGILHSSAIPEMTSRQPLLF